MEHFPAYTVLNAHATNYQSEMVPFIHIDIRKEDLSRLKAVLHLRKYSFANIKLSPVRLLTLVLTSLYFRQPSRETVIFLNLNPKTLTPNFFTFHKLITNKIAHIFEKKSSEKSWFLTFS